MIVEIKDDKILKILEDRAELHKEITVVNEEIMKLDKDRTKKGYKMDKLKEKTKVIMDKLDPELGEFEVITSVSIQDGKPVYEVLDMVEEYKKAVREDKKKKDVA